MIKKFCSVVLGLSVLLTVISLTIQGGIGQSLTITLGSNSTSVTTQSADGSLSQVAGHDKLNPAAAICGSNVQVVYIKSAATLLQQKLLLPHTGLGLSFSTNGGGSFNETSYVSGLTGNSITGAPTVGCTSSSNFIAVAGGQQLTSPFAGRLLKWHGPYNNLGVPSVLYSLPSNSFFSGNPALAVDPRNPNNIVIGFTVDQFGSATCPGGTISTVKSLFSINGGGSFSGPFNATSVCGNPSLPSVGNPSVFWNGSHIPFVTYTDDLSDQMTQLVLINSGKTGFIGWNAPVTVATGKVPGTGSFLKSGIPVDPTPSGAVDLSTLHPNRIYEVYASGNFSVSDVESPSKWYFSPDIFFTQSDTNGSSWVAPKRVNDNSKTATTISDQYEPRVVVNGSGIVFFSWFDRRIPPYVNRDLFGATSNNGGSTVSKNVRITTVSSVPQGGDLALSFGASLPPRDDPAMLVTPLGVTVFDAEGQTYSMNDILEEFLGFIW